MLTPFLIGRNFGIEVRICVESLDIQEHRRLPPSFWMGWHGWNTEDMILPGLPYGMAVNWPRL